MKKNKLMSYLALGIVFAFFNVIAFVIPTNKTATFWMAYIFTVIAFFLQTLVWKVAFGKQDNLKSRFLGIPIIRVGLTYLMVQLIVFAFFMICPTLNVWLAVVVCSIVFAIFALCTIAGQVGTNEIKRVEDKINAKRSFIQLLQIDIEMLAATEPDAETKVELFRLAEKARFSDPISHEILGELESKISAKVEQIKTTTDKKALIEEIDLLLADRNKKCEMLKGRN